MSTHPTQQPTNPLAKAASAYLRSAMHQPTHWYEWSPEAFAEADLQGKPILLDIGAVWCHWCHVMDRESYESDETRSEEHTSELQSRENLVCRLLLEKKK